MNIQVNMQFSGLNKIHSQLTAYIQAKLRVRLRFRVRVRIRVRVNWPHARFGPYRQ